MFVLSMLARSILSYTVFLGSRKIVRGGIGAGSALVKGMKLHRCYNCWSLYSGEISECSFCGEHVQPLYRIYEDDDYGPYERPEEFEKREGLEKQIFNDSRGLKFKPLKPTRFEVRDDRNTRRPSPESGRSNQRRDSNSPRHFDDNRGRGYSNRRRDSKLGQNTR